MKHRVHWEGEWNEAHGSRACVTEPWE